MKRFLLILTAAFMLVFFVSAITVSAADPVISPTPTVYPDGPTGPTKPTTGPGGSTTVPGGPDITTAKPGDPQTLPTGDDATGGKSTTGKGGESSTAKPDDSDTSPDTGESGKLLGAALILVSGMTVAAFVEPKAKKTAQPD